MGLNNKDLVAHCKRFLTMPTKYMWGEYGRIITENIIQQKANQYPNRYSENRKAELRKHINTHRGCDCVCLIKSYGWGFFTKWDYSAYPDRGTEGLFDMATEKGTINTMPEIKGLAVHMSGHVGVYIGNGEVIECTLSTFGDGVVKTKLQGRGWTHWYKIPLIEYFPAKKTNEEIAKEVINGKWNVGEERKKKLTAAGYVYADVQKIVNELLKK